MTLTELLAGVDDAQVFGGSVPVEIAEVRDDSRLVTPGDLFVAIQGAVVDGRQFVGDAVRRRAGAVLLERRADDPSAGVPGGPWGDFAGAVVTVSDVRRALAVIAANRYRAVESLTLTAVTGTNGKTTTTYLMESIFGAAGIRTGVIGTVTYRVGGQGQNADGGGAGLFRSAPLTTPGALALHGLFAEMVRAGATDVVLEASSHALEQERLDGCRFRVAGLTNLTQDHLDYHGSMERYFDAKAILFERLLDKKTGVAVLPLDRPEGRAMRARVLASGGASVLGVAVDRATPGADIQVESVQMSAQGMRLRLATPIGPLAIASPLVGGFNVANIVLAIGMAIARGLDDSAIEEGLERLAGVPGRLERVGNDAGVLCVVDYAHTPDALERALAAVRPLVRPGGRLLTVFGCGGDRDRTKRPLMGQAAVAASELAVVTSDNPRTESPGEIISMIVEGIRQSNARALSSAQELRSWPSPPPPSEGEQGTPDAGDGGTAERAYYVEPDRRLAIAGAVSAARTGDVVLIAGKGHEDYQIIGTTRIPFDDRKEAAEAFARWQARKPAVP